MGRIDVWVRTFLQAVMYLLVRTEVRRSLDKSQRSEAGASTPGNILKVEYLNNKPTELYENTNEATGHIGEAIDQRTLELNIKW